MNILISTQTTIEYDGSCYFGNSANAVWQRYHGYGNSVLICHVKNVNKATQDKLDENIRFVTIKKINSVGAIIKRFSRYNDKVADSYVQKADFCIVHLPSDNGYQVIKYCKKYGKPYLTIVCGCSWDALWNHGWQGKLLATYGYIKLRKAQKSAPYSIYVTNEFLQHRYPTKGRAIGCSNVNITTGNPIVLENRLRNINLRTTEGKILKIGTAAALDVAYKGQEYVILALSKLKKEGLIFEYHLIGRGNDSRLKEIAEQAGVTNQVVFHGAIPHEKVLEFLDDMDIYVQPSKQEGLPRSLIEAMSRGCLCLGSKTAGIPELLESQYIFPKGDVKAISKILSSITENEFVKQANRNFEKAKEYDRRVLNEKRNNFIHDIIELTTTQYGKESGDNIRNL